MTLRHSWNIFKKYLYRRFHKISSNGSRVVPCGRKKDGQRDRRTDMRQLIVDFRNFSKSPKITLRHLVFLFYYNVNKSRRGLFKFDLPSTEVLTHHELGHVPQIRPTNVLSFFSPWFQFEHAIAIYVRLWLCLRAACFIFTSLPTIL
jgi:hypothetical protein